MKPAYMEPDSVVRAEFKEFCADSAMDILSVECAPEVCALIKGKARVRALPAGASKRSQQSGATSKRHHLRHNF